MIIFDSGLAEAKTVMGTLRGLVKIPGSDAEAITESEEMIFVSLRKAFTELVVSARSDRSFACFRSEMTDIHATMDEALTLFGKDVIRRKPLEQLRDILALPEDELLHDDIETLFALNQTH